MTLARESAMVALIQMKAETLRQIEEALAPLRDGEYGHCFDCGAEISEERLGALPFAVQCGACEDLREADEGRRGRLFARRDGRGALPVWRQAV